MKHNKKEKQKLKKQNGRPKIKRTSTEKLALAFLVLGIIALVIGFLPLTSIVAVMFFAVILILLAVLTMFTIFFNKKFTNLLDKSNKIVNKVQEYIPYTPYLFAAAGVLFTFSLIAYCFSKNKARKIKGIIATTILIILSVIGIAFTVSQL